MIWLIKNNIDRIVCGFLLTGILLIAFVSEARASDLCIFNTGIEYCDYGCCDNRCCGLSTIAIVGLVIGAVLSLVTVVGCVVCLVCMCKQSAARQSAVQPYHNNNSVVVNNTAPFHHPPPRPPPSYDQYNSYPGGSNPAYGFGDSVYPPGFLQTEKQPPPPYTYSQPPTSRR